MGCVYSHAEDNKHRRHRPPPPQPQTTRKRPLPNKTTNNGRLPSADLRKPLASEPKLSNTTTTSHNTSLPPAAAEDMQFRRQHFDRNSVLRHSKKRTRKNSTASGNGSVTSPKPSVTVATAAENGKEDAAEPRPLSQVCALPIKATLMRSDRQLHFSVRGGHRGLGKPRNGSSRLFTCFVHRRFFPQGR